MKNSFLIVLTLCSSHLYGLDGVVTVLSAPLFKKPSHSAVIVQYARRGEILVIVDKSTIESEFIPVWDKLTKVAYIKANYLKVYSDNMSAQSEKRINRDPTDYRLNEPLPEDYPAPPIRDIILDMQ